jgi:hypothetical protein
MTQKQKLLIVKFLHTIIWTFFASLVFYVLYASLFNFIHWTVWTSIALVILEGMIIFMNGWKCPLTNVAERYTDHRADNFDIFLPAWLARHNKSIFTFLFLLGVVGILVRILTA